LVTAIGIEHDGLAVAVRHAHGFLDSAEKLVAVLAMRTPEPLARAGYRRLAAVGADSL
jgi:hypothetical protein